MIDGEDITTGAEPTGFSYTCRVYFFGEEPTGVIPSWYFREKLLAYRPSPGGTYL